MGSSPLTVNDIRSLAIAYTDEVPLPITSIDFSIDGLGLIAATKENLYYYSITSSQPSPSEIRVHCGSELVSFIASSNLILHSSFKPDNAICLLNHENKGYERFFPGHAARVCSISPSHTNNFFASSSEDSTIRLWDIRKQDRVDIIKTSAPSFVSFQPLGFQFAAAVGSSNIQLYDLRNRKHCSSEFELEKGFDWSGLKYSDDGHTLLISTLNGSVLTADINKKRESGRFSGYMSERRPVEASFTPYSKFIASGASNGMIHFWNALSGKTVVKICGYNNRETVQCLKFNQKFMMMATAIESKLMFWIEDL